MRLIAYVPSKSLPLRNRLMRAALRIQARIGQPQTLHRTAMQQVLLDDLPHVPGMHKPVPDGIRIHHHHRTMFALVQAPQLVRPDLPLQPSLLDRVLERSLQLSATLVGATWARCTLVAFIGADEQVMLELRHS
jgi:hypothetical protein